MKGSGEALDIDNIKIEEDSAFEQIVDSKGKNMNWGKLVPVAVIGISMSLFHMYTAGFGILPAWEQRSVLLSFVLLLIPFYFPFKAKLKPLRLVVDAIYLLAAVTAVIYIMLGYPEIIYRVGSPNTADLIIGSLVVILVLEGVRRTVGKAMTILVAIFIAYVFLGAYIPGTLGHPGFSFSTAIDNYFNSTFGVFGLILGAMSNYIIIFIIFGAFLAKSHAGKFFIETAYALTGSNTGGPAKVAVLASGMMGMISGAAVSNVVTTGSLTIPLMKRVGYKPHFAGAVEVSASAGGQLLPPVMGAAAFIIAANLQIPYIELCLIALIPAILHYVAIFLMVHFEAKKNNLEGIPKEELPDKKTVFKEGWFLLIPIALIIGLLILGYSPQFAGFYSIISVVLVSMFRKKTRMDWKNVIGALEIGAKNSVSITVICAAAGILIGSITLTGLGLKFSSIVFDLTGGILLIALILAMITSILLGMGMPTVSAYVLLAVLGVPALSQLGIEPIAAHMFVFYFAIMSNVTPPVAVGAYAAAAIAKSNPNKTGLLGLKLCLGTFIIPYMFVYGPALLMQGTGSEVVLAAITALTGIFALTSALQGWMLTRMTRIQRVLGVISALLLIHTGWITDTIGVTFLLIGVASQWKNRKSVHLQNLAS
jgi:TRAP transporter 4TM/12TM fusion protein